MSLIEPLDLLALLTAFAVGSWRSGRLAALFVPLLFVTGGGASFAGFLLFRAGASAPPSVAVERPIVIERPSTETPTPPALPRR